MEYRQLGGSGLYVPALCLGTATFGGTNGFEGWGHTKVEEATRMVNLCLDAGVNLFDTADVYSNGLSEEILGKAIHGLRNRLLISTKATFNLSPESRNAIGSSRFHLIQACEASLRRLNTDHIDIYHMHGFDANTPVEETLRALDDLVTSGKVRYIACSNFSGWHLMKSLSVSERYGWPVRGPTGLLLLAEPGVRVGTDAARHRPEGGRHYLEPLIRRTSGREVPPE